MTFIAATAALSFGGDGAVPASPPHLRGTIAPDAVTEPRLPADAKRA